MSAALCQICSSSRKVLIQDQQVPNSSSSFGVKKMKISHVR